MGRERVGQGRPLHALARGREGAPPGREVGGGEASARGSRSRPDPVRSTARRSGSARRRAADRGRRAGARPAGSPGRSCSRRAPGPAASSRHAPVSRASRRASRRRPRPARSGRRDPRSARSAGRPRPRSTAARSSFVSAGRGAQRDEPAGADQPPREARRHVVGVASGRPRARSGRGCSRPRAGSRARASPWAAPRPARPTARSTRSRAAACSARDAVARSERPTSRSSPSRIT